MKRTDFLQLLEASLAAKQYAYARDMASQFLGEWPGDLAVQTVLGRALAAESQWALAADVLAAVVAADPEDALAQRVYGDQHEALGNRAGAQHAHACAHVGDGRGVNGGVPAWAAAARAAYVAEKTGDWDTAQSVSLAALKTEPPGPLASLVHLSALWHAGMMDLARPLAEGFHARWESVVAFKLCLAECLLAAGERVRAIELLHEAAAEDQGGQVVNRHWGANHPYRSLWDSNADAKLLGPMPAALAAALGMNRLATAPVSVEPDGAQPKAEVPNELEQIQAQLDRVAARLPSKVALKHRLSRMKTGPGAAARGGDSTLRPNYIILTSRTRLLQTFGQDGFAQIENALKTLTSRANSRPGWKASRVYVDDPTTLSPFGLRPVNPANAFEVKTLVGQLAERLAQTNSSLGALLIVGGGNIVPFHHLPNPTDDVDGDIPSDNPYATADDNYFVPEWPVGRLPNGAGGDPALLVKAIRAAAGAPLASTGPGYAAWMERLRQWLRLQWVSRSGTHSFGYSANVWKSASAAVYTQIGDPKDLLTSPPLDANALPVEGLAPSRLSYFNLHGIEDGPEWYGQRSFDDPGTLPEYPVALRPADVVNSGRAPVVVFSEACYGANILDKDTEAALCLKFLELRHARDGRLDQDRLWLGDDAVGRRRPAGPLLLAEHECRTARRRVLAPRRRRLRLGPERNRAANGKWCNGRHHPPLLRLARRRVPALARRLVQDPVARHARARSRVGGDEVEKAARFSRAAGRFHGLRAGRQEAAELPVHHLLSRAADPAPLRDARHPQRGRHAEEADGHPGRRPGRKKRPGDGRCQVPRMRQSHPDPQGRLRLLYGVWLCGCLRITTNLCIPEKTFTRVNDGAIVLGLGIVENDRSWPSCITSPPQERTPCPPRKARPICRSSTGACSR